MALELVLITSAIGAYERGYMAVVDISGSFLTADMDRYLIMVLRGRLAELMVNTKPIIYQKIVRIENGRTVLYIKV